MAERFDLINDPFVDLVDQHVLGDRQRALVGISPALHELCFEPGLFHGLRDRLAPAVHDDRADAHRRHDAHVLKQTRQGVRFVHNRTANLHHHHPKRQRNHPNTKMCKTRYAPPRAFNFRRP